MIKLSISNIAWAPEYDKEIYHFLQKTAFQGLEIAPTRIFPEDPYDKLIEAKEWARDIKKMFGLKVSSMQSIWFGHQEKIFGTKKERKFLVDYTKKAVNFAEVIGCKNLVFGNPKNRDTDDMIGCLPTAIDFFREIGDYAMEHNTCIAIEANPVIYNTHFLNTTEQTVEMAYKCNSNGIKINLDLGAIIYNGEDVNYIKQIPEYINHVHISEPGLCLIKKRNIHISLVKVLKDIKYKNYLSIEMGRQEWTEDVKKIIIYVKNLTV